MHQHSLKVLVVSRLYPRPSDTVLGIFVEEEVKGLSKHCQIKVASPTPWFPPLKLFKRWYAYSRIPLHELRDGIEVFRPRALLFPRNLLFSLAGFSSYLSLLGCAKEIERDFPFDLIHAHTAYPDGFAAAMLGRALRRPVVITLHGGDVTVYFKRYLWRRLGLWGLSHADRVIAVSHSLRSAVVEKHRVAKDAITIIPNGVDVTKFLRMPRVDAEDRLGLESDALRILYVGGIKRAKGIGYLLRAAKSLLESVERPVQLYLVGEGDYEQKAKRLATELGIADAVAFVGKRPNSEIPLWMNACDLLVLPSLSEGFGVVLIEAMACGKPVVATMSGGPDHIVTRDTGVLVPPGDEAALAKALHDVLMDGDQADPRKIRQHAVEKYAYHEIAPRLLEVYRQLIPN